MMSFNSAVIVTLLLMLATTPCHAAPVAVVLSTDCGADMDDQWALAHILLSTELDLRGVIASHAFAIGLSPQTAAMNATDVITRVSASRPLAKLPPVVSGASAPLRDTRTPRQSEGVDMLLRLSRTFSASHRLMVFVIGAGTDVASALLKDRTIADRIVVVSMGFDDWPAGRDGFNVKNDPLAWQVILRSRVPLVIGSNALTKRDLRLTRAEGKALMQSHGVIGEYLYSLFDQWLTQRADLATQFVAPDTWVVWDEVVVAYALGFAKGMEVPRPKLQSDLTFSHPRTTRRVTWLTKIDTERVWQDFLRKIDAG